MRRSCTPGITGIQWIVYLCRKASFSSFSKVWDKMYLRTRAMHGNAQQRLSVHRFIGAAYKIQRLLYLMFRWLLQPFQLNIIKNALSKLFNCSFVEQYFFPVYFHFIASTRWSEHTIVNVNEHMLNAMPSNTLALLYYAQPQSVYCGVLAPIFRLCGVRFMRTW